MPKTLVALLAGVVIAGMVSASLAQGPREGRRAWAGSRPAAEGPRLGERLAERIAKELNLTDDQQKQLKQVFQTHRQDVQNWEKENQAKVRDLRTQRQDAQKAGDKDKVTAVDADLQKLMASRKALFDNLVKQLGDVLKPDQLEKAKQMIARVTERPGVAAVAGLAALDLSADQQEKARAIQKEAREKMRATKDPKEKAAIEKAAWEKIKSDVLTPEQRQRLEQMGKFHVFFQTIQRLGLTDDQKKQIQDIWQDATAQVEKAATPDQKKETVKAAFKKIDAVLTDEQRQKLKQLREQRQKEHPRGGRGAGMGAASRPHVPTSAPANAPE